MEGWIKLHRKLLDSGLLEDSVSSRLFLWILLSVTSKKIETFHRGSIVELERGQMIFSREKAASALMVTERRIRTGLNVLKTTNRVSTKTTNRFTLLTVCKWDAYQIEESKKDQQNDQQSVIQKANRRPTEGQQTYIGINILQEGKEGKEEEKENINVFSKEKKVKRACQFPENFCYSQKHIELANECGFDEAELKRAFAQFEDYNKSKGNTYKDWSLALNTWIRRHRPNQNRQSKGSSATDYLKRSLKEQIKKEGDLF